MATAPPTVRNQPTALLGASWLGSSAKLGLLLAGSAVRLLGEGNEAAKASWAAAKARQRQRTAHVGSRVRLRLDLERRRLCAHKPLPPRNGGLALPAPLTGLSGRCAGRSSLMAGTAACYAKVMPSLNHPTARGWCGMRRLARGGEVRRCASSRASSSAHDQAPGADGRAAVVRCQTELDGTA